MEYSGAFPLIFVIWIVGFAAMIWGLVDAIRVPTETAAATAASIALTRAPAVVGSRARPS